MNNEELTVYLSIMVNKLNSIIEMFKELDCTTREQEIAMQKLEEAVFWLTYGVEENE